MRAFTKLIRSTMNHVLLIKRIQAAQAALRQSVFGTMTVAMPCTIDAWSKHLH